MQNYLASPFFVYARCFISLKWTAENNCPYRREGQTPKRTFDLILCVAVRGNNVHHLKQAPVQQHDDHDAQDLSHKLHPRNRLHPQIRDDTST